MIPLAKLAALPRGQRLRKAWKTFAEAENTLLRGGALGRDLRGYLGELAAILAGDAGFDAPQRAALLTAGEGLSRPDPGDPAAERRLVNGVRHILLTATGRSAADWDFTGPKGALDRTGGPGVAGGRTLPGVTAWLEDIRSPFNVGAMFRTAEFFGAERLFLSPLCADPLHPRARRAAMGCVEALPWERRALACLPGPLFALETGGTPLPEFRFPPQGTLIAGSEELGVSPEALAAAEASLGRVSIPGLGAKASLNVSVAFGIVMHTWSLERGKP